MFLIDTNVVSEARKGTKANSGVTAFFNDVSATGAAVYLSAISVGELRRGVELIFHRGDIDQARRLDIWLTGVVEEFGEKILAFDADAAQVWGKLRVPRPEHALDKQIAAIALVNDLTVVTRKITDFAETGVKLQNPFLPARAAG
jgi:predicted nucleic acid-binding protein